MVTCNLTSLSFNISDCLYFTDSRLLNEFSVLVSFRVAAYEFLIHSHTKHIFD